MVRRRKDNRGGVRQGQPGRAYAQRTDLNLNTQAIRAGPSAGYGQRVAQEEAQRAVPLAGAAPAPAGAPRQAPRAFVDPDDVPTPGQPTRRPQEPLTAGLPFGPGPGPREVLGAPDVLGDRLRALYLAYPTQELAELLEAYAAGD